MAFFVRCAAVAGAAFILAAGIPAPVSAQVMKPAPGAPSGPIPAPSAAPRDEADRVPPPPLHPVVPAPAANEGEGGALAMPPADSTGMGANRGTAADLQWPIPAAASALRAEGDGIPTFEELTNNVAHNQISLDLDWTVLAGLLVLLVPAGFALFHSGLGRARNAAHTLTLHFMALPLAVLAFWAAGFALLSGGLWKAPGPIGASPSLGQGLAWLNREYEAGLFGHVFGLWGYRGFALAHVFDTAVLGLFLFQCALAVAAAAIPIGALAERWRFRHFVLSVAVVGIVPFSLLGNWVWGGGWLAQLGVNFRLGHGAVDFAGSGAVHLLGGLVALIGAARLGARAGKYHSKDGRPVLVPPHSLPLVVLGAFLLAFAWVGIDAGATLAGTDHRLAVVAVNALLSAAAGAAAACLAACARTGKPEPALLCGGLLSGLAAVAAPCAFVHPIAAVGIGAVAGLLFTWGVGYLERRKKVDDPAGAVSIHALGGAWGVVALGLFADGSYGQGWGGVHRLVRDGALQTVVNDGDPETARRFADLVAAGWRDQGVTGLLGRWCGGAYCDAGQLAAQLLLLAAVVGVGGGLAWLWFRFSGKITPLRVPPEDEQMGIDFPEVGAEAYPRISG